MPPSVGGRHSMRSTRELPTLGVPSFEIVSHLPRKLVSLLTRLASKARDLGLLVVGQWPVSYAHSETPELRLRLAQPVDGVHDILGRDRREPGLELEPRFEVSRFRGGRRNSPGVDLEELDFPDVGRSDRFEGLAQHGAVC